MYIRTIMATKGLVFRSEVIYKSNVFKRQKQGRGGGADV